MSREPTDLLYVNLSASKVRKRLKHRGLGVRKVEAADRNQAVIVHTATGDHFQELKSLLADVLSSEFQETTGTPIENLRNLGPTSAGWLREIGIHSRENLEQIGPVSAYRLVKRKHPSVSRNLLWALVAALGDRDAHELSDDEKELLRSEAED